MEPNQCLELEVVRPRSRGNGGNHGGGARIKLDVRRFKRICRLIEEGASHVIACQVEGISYTLLRLRVTKRLWWARRLAQADKIRHELRYEWHLANLTAKAEHDVRLSALWLERHGFPKPAGSLANGAGVDLSLEARAHLAELARHICKVALEQAATEPPEPPPPNNVIAIERTGT